MSYRISDKDYSQYVSEQPSKVDLIWCDIIANLPERLKREAKDKGFSLISEVEVETAKQEVEMNIIIDGASTQLNSKLKNMSRVVMVKRNA